MTKVIIGAGPAGLYAAIKLRKEGVLDAVVYDPRAGNYTRPGHLNRNVFTQAQQGTNTSFWKTTGPGHIKDLERGLYQEAQRLGIKIEHKRFVRLHEDAKSPGVVVAGSEGQEEIVAADYVFDCTGARREVVAAVNRLVPDSPLQLTTITLPPVRHHFLAYVKISDSDWQTFNSGKRIVDTFPDTIDALTYARSIIKLRELGWKEFRYPRCYGQSFGKEKVCAYFHAPESLSHENYDKWVETVLNCYTAPSTISFHHLPPPPAPKPRFVAFTADAQALKQVSFKGKNLPTVTALGDAQIDFDYARAHGIYDGMKRIDALLEHMEIINGQICYFDSVEYMNAMVDLMREHKKEVTEYAENLRASFARALASSQLKFRQALMLSTDPDERIAIIDILKEIEARQSYVKAREAFAGCHDKENHVVLTSTNLSSVMTKLGQIHTNLVTAYADLPASFVTERSDVKNLLTDLAVSWKEVGNALFKSHKMAEAIDVYKKALDIYNLPGFVGVHVEKELSLYSNLAIVYLHEKQHSEAIAAANTALSVFAKCLEANRKPGLQEKIVFNLIKALCGQAEEYLRSKKHGDAKSLHSQAKQLMCEHENILTSPTVASISNIVEELQQRLSSTLLRTSSNDLVRNLVMLPPKQKSKKQNSFRDTLFLLALLALIWVYSLQNLIK